MAFKKPTSKPGAAKKIAAELHQQMLDNVEQLVTSDAWPKLLKAMTEKNGTELSRFSFNNMLLILAQMPEATAVATFKAWKERGRSILKGSKSIRVYAPMTLQEKDETGDPVKARDGAAKKFTGFRMIPEFDVSQTEPTWQDPHGMFITAPVSRPPLALEIQGDAPEQMAEDVTRQLEDLGYTVETGNTGSANGYTNPQTMTVRVSDRVSPAQAAKTLAHELGHVLADHVSDLEAYRKHRGQAETVAESFAWMVSNIYGLDTTQYSAPYISTWAGRNPEEILKAVQHTGTEVLTMFRAFLVSVQAPEAEQAAQVSA